jgi:hypothetical protein
MNILQESATFGKSYGYLSRNVELYTMIVLQSGIEGFLNLNWLANNCFVQGEHRE